MRQATLILTKVDRFGLMKVLLGWWLGLPVKLYSANVRMSRAAFTSLLSVGKVSTEHPDPSGFRFGPYSLLGIAAGGSETLVLPLVFPEALRCTTI